MTIDDGYKSTCLRGQVFPLEMRGGNTGYSGGNSNVSPSPLSAKWLNLQASLLFDCHKSARITLSWHIHHPWLQSWCTERWKASTFLKLRPLFLLAVHRWITCAGKQKLCSHWPLLDPYKLHREFSNGKIYITEAHLSFTKEEKWKCSVKLQ